MYLDIHGQVNSLRLKSNIALKWASKHLMGSNLFAVDGTFLISLSEQFIDCKNKRIDSNNISLFNKLYKL